MGSSELTYAAADLNGTTVHVPRTTEPVTTRRNRSCRATSHESHSRSHSRHHHRNVRAPARDRSNDRRDLSVLDDHHHVAGEGKENFIVPCTPKTPRQKPRPVTVVASPARNYQRTPSSPPACLTTTLPATSEIFC